MCEVKDQEVDVLRRLVQYDAGFYSKKKKKTLSYNTLRDRLLSCLDELYSNEMDDDDDDDDDDRDDRKQSNGVRSDRKENTTRRDHIN